MREIRILIALFIAAAALSGCADLKYKFIRKKDEGEEKIKRYYPVRQYDVRPSVELYTKRFVFWKTWHDELLNVLTDSNEKKAKVAAEQAISNLLDMQKMLVDEKADGLQKIIDEMTMIEKEMKMRRISGANEVRLRKNLEVLGKKVRSEYNQKKMSRYLAREFRPSEIVDEEEEE